MINRRDFISLSSFLALLPMVNINAKEFMGKNMENFYMAEEANRHKRTWMAFVANDFIWSKKQLPEIKRNLVLIASTIAKYEPVNMLVNKYDKEELISLLNSLDNHKFPINIIEKDIDDLWFRDTAPTFVYDKKGKKYGIDFNFNGWGDKQEHKYDSKVAQFISKYENLELIKSKYVLEGGCFEIDGEGTAIMTESCSLNDNRNPNVSKRQIEEELKYLLGLEKIIWLKGLKGKDITDAHTDFYARFISSDELIVAYEPYKKSYEHKLTKENIEILKNAKNKDGKKFKITILENPQIINEKFGIRDFASGYIGYYLCNGAVIMQGFGDKKADKKAKDILKKVYPNRVIEQINIDAIASGGGTIHCATQQEPLDLTK